MPAKAKINKSFKEKKKRMLKVPTIIIPVLYGMRKQDAADFIKIFHDGIKNRTFGLQKLAKSTKDWKKKQGYQFPNTPLYGKGDDEKKKSYVNMLRITKLKNGWKLYPSWGKHHKAKNMKLKALLDVHETGRDIIRGTKIIHIPARPAFFLTTSIFLKRFRVRRKNEKKLMDKGIRDYIRTGKSDYFDKYIDIYKSKYNDIVE